MMVVFFTALLLIATMVAAPRILLEGKREKEKEMIWRGHQYVRGVKLYYRKMGRFPTSIDDLTKPKTGSLRFMRQAYKDPMNGEDGSWRLIYVGPAGQLIGSLKPPQSLQLPNGRRGVGHCGIVVGHQQHRASQVDLPRSAPLQGSVPLAILGFGCLDPLPEPRRDLARLAPRHLQEAGAALLSLERNRSPDPAWYASKWRSQMPKVVRRMAVNLGSLVRVVSQHRGMGRNPHLPTHRARLRATRCPRRKL